jgi:3-oxo-5-alpha-steroid 4-dehydrogenase 3
LLIVAKGAGFVQNSKTEFKIAPKEAVLALGLSIVFIYFWYKQYESNMIFINLRKSKSGKIATETHLIPRGGLFQYVSSPHMTCEVAMYCVLYILLLNNSSYIYCLSWVITNQFSNALLTHKWYKHTFSDYPTERKALVPFII